ncbi:MAG: nucleotidyltransferase domain-containing protein [Myxococcaceae bacterium]
MHSGLSQAVFEKICQALKKNPKLKKVYLFGSRAMGRHKPGSDIDLAVDGIELSFDDILSMRLDLDRLMLPYKFDIVNYAEADPALLEHIKRVGVEIIHL